MERVRKRCVELGLEEAGERRKQVNRKPRKLDGAGNALMLLWWMPELGSAGNRHAASLPGVAPCTKDSGKAHAQGNTHGGRRGPRDAMYMAAQSAARWNPDLAAPFNQPIANGKKHKVAIVAVMRKLVILANVQLRDGRHWRPRAPETAVAARG